LDPITHQLLESLSPFYSIVFLVHLQDPSYQQTIAKLFTSLNSVEESQILFAEAWNSRVHMIRQLGVDCVVEGDERVAVKVKKWTRHVVYVGKEKIEDMACVEEVKDAIQVLEQMAKEE
jgi:hypothetical protein